MAKPAQQKPAPKIKINMLHPQGEHTQIATRFLKWLTGYGRYIIIIVEIVVLICFLLKFKLEADNQKLIEQITSEAQSIQGQASNEQVIKQTQQKLQQIKQNFETTPEWAGIIDKIAKRIPTTTQLVSLGLDHPQASKNVQFKLNAVTSSNGDINIFLNSLRDVGQPEESQSFKDVNLVGVTYDQGKLTFTISGESK